MQKKKKVVRKKKFQFATNEYAWGGKCVTYVCVQFLSEALCLWKQSNKMKLRKGEEELK